MSSPARVNLGLTLAILWLFLLREAFRLTIGTISAPKMLIVTAALCAQFNGSRGRPFPFERAALLIVGVGALPRTAASDRRQRLDAAKRLPR